MKLYREPDGDNPSENTMVECEDGEWLKLSELRELLEYQRKWNRTAKLYEKAKEDEWLLAELSDSRREKRHITNEFTSLSTPAPARPKKEKVTK